MNNVELERRQAWAQRAVLAVALAGIVSTAVAWWYSTSEGGNTGDRRLSAEYERVLHAREPSRLRITFRAHGPQSLLALDRDYAQVMSIEDVRPRPRSISRSTDEVVYAFNTGDARHVNVVFDVRPRKAGRVNATVRLYRADRKATLNFRQLVFP